MTAARKSGVAGAAALLVVVGLLSTTISTEPAGAAGGVLPTSTAATASATIVTAGSPITLTATVSALGLGGLLVTPSGKVTFTGPAPFGKRQVLGSATVTPNCLLTITPCRATLQTAALPAGTDPVTATYNGDLVTASSFATATVTVTPVPPTPPVLTNVTPSGGQDVLTWTPPTASALPVLGYDVYEGTTAGDFVQVSQGVQGARFVNGGIDPDAGARYYAVTAVSLGGESAVSNVLGSVPMQPSSEDLIAAALAGGTIDYPTSLVYRAYALWNDPRLPAQYRGSGPTTDDQVLAEMYDAEAALPPGAADPYAPLLVRPTDPTSVFSVRPAPGPGGVAGAGPRAAAADAGSAPCKSWSGPTVVQTFDIWVCSHGSAANDAGALAGAEDSLARYTKAENTFMGISTGPLADRPTAGSKTNPDANIDVYLVDPYTTVTRPTDDPSPPLGTTALAYTVPTAPAAATGNNFTTASGATSAYILMGYWDAYRAAKSAGAATNEFRATFAHEYFHALQMAYSQRSMDQLVNGKWQENWFTEASATWAETKFVPEDDNDPVAGAYPFFNRVGFPSNFINRPDVSLDVPEGVGGPHHSYASFIWPYFMRQQESLPGGGAGDSVAAVWKALSGKSTAKDVLDAVNAQTPFAKNFRSFALRNLDIHLQPAAGGDPLGGHYQDMDPSFPYNVTKPAPPAPAADAEPSRGMPDEPLAIDPRFSDVHDELLYAPHLTAQYDEVDPSLAAGLKITFKFPTTNDLTYDVLANVKNVGWKDLPVTTGTLSLCTAKAAEDATDLWIVISNPGTDPSADVPESSYEIDTAPCDRSHLTASLTETISGGTTTGSSTDHLEGADGKEDTFETSETRTSGPGTVHAQLDFTNDPAKSFDPASGSYSVSQSATIDHAEPRQPCCNAQGQPESYYVQCADEVHVTVNDAQALDPSPGPDAPQLFYRSEFTPNEDEPAGYFDDTLQLSIGQWAGFPSPGPPNPQVTLTATGTVTEGPANPCDNLLQEDLSVWQRTEGGYPFLVCGAIPDSGQGSVSLSGSPSVDSRGDAVGASDLFFNPSTIKESGSLSWDLAPPHGDPNDPAQTFSTCHPDGESY